MIGLVECCKLVICLIVLVLIHNKPASFGFGGRWIIGNTWYHEDVDEYGRINVNALNEGNISFIDTAVQPHPWMGLWLEGVRKIEDGGVGIWDVESL